MSAALHLLGGAGTGSAELLFLLFWGKVWRKIYWRKLWRRISVSVVEEEEEGG